MKQKLENVMRNKKMMIALMEILIAIGCIVIFYLTMSSNNRAKETTYSYSKVEEVTEYRVVDNYITRVMPLTSYETFKEIAENTLNAASEDVQYTIKVYSDAEKTEEITEGYIASGMVVEAIEKTEEVPQEEIENQETEQENGELPATDEPTEGNEIESVVETETTEESEEIPEEITGTIYTVSVLGDMTQDGDISIGELTKLIKGVVGLTDWRFTEEEELSADISGDNEINVVDIELCINYIVFGKLDFKEATFTVIFKDYDGREISKKKDYHYGDTIEIPEEPTRESDEIYVYEFAGWAPVISEKVTKDEVYVATYKAIEIATEGLYKVEHYKETKEGTYELVETEELVGKIGEEVTVTAKEYTGYRENVESEDRIVAGTVLEDGSLVLKLYYDRNTYTVIFKDEDGTEISTKTYKYEDTVEVPENPSKAEDNTYTYEFSGWTPEVEETVTGNVEYTATYKETYKEYTVVFKNDDGISLNTRTYHYGDTIEIPENPSKAEDNTYTYEFAGWTPEVKETVIENAEYTATFTSTYKEYTITFTDDDGTILSEKKDYHYGDTIEVPEDPMKEADETYTYEFAGWDKEITTVERDTEYKAVYIKKYIDYTVIFKDENGNIINSKVYHYGDTLVKPQDPVRESTIEHAYTFTGWTPEVKEIVTDNVEYTAIFEEQEIKYSIIFYNYDGITEVSRIEDYTWGDSFVFPESPTKEPTEEIYYVFTAWNNLGVEEISATDKRIKLVAQYREEYFVARVEETETLEGASYLSLEDAIENAGSEERTVRLLQDTEESVMVEDNQNITINLNGKTVTGTKNYAIKNYGVLVVTDETEEKTGKIVDIVSSEIGYGIHNKEGQVTIKGGTIVTETSEEIGATYGIYNQSELPLVIEGGSIIAEAKGKGSVSAGIYILAGKEITVTGGYVLGNATAENATSYGIYNETEGKINVTNGRVEGKTSLASGVSYGIYNEISQEVRISGGTVAAQSDKSTAYGVYNNQGKVIVTEGNIEVTAATGYGIYNESGVVDVQEGKTTMIGTTSYGIYNNAGTTNVTGGNIELTSSTAYGIYNKNQMSITGGKITAKTSGSSTYGIYNNSEKELSIQNVKITDLYYGIYNNIGKVEVTNANIKASTGIYNNNSPANTIINSAEIEATSNGVYNYQGSTNIKSADISSNQYGVYNYYGNVIIENANIISQQYGVYNNNTGNIEIGTKDKNISTEQPSIYGKTNAIYNGVTSSGKVKYYDGILTGKSVIYGGVNEIEENSEIVVTTNEEGNEVAILQNIEEVAVAKIGNTTYTSLSSAVEAVAENATETTTIELITDFDISNSVEIPENKNVTIDLAGHTTTTYAKGGIVNKGTFTITDSTEDGLGKIISGIGIGISNEGNLNVTNGTIESTQYGIYNYNYGNSIMNGGTIKSTSYGIYNTGSSAITKVQHGRIIADKGIRNYYGEVNVKGGIIQGRSRGIDNDYGTVNIIDGKIISDDVGIYTFAYSGIITITGGYIEGNTGVYISSYAILTIGEKDNIVDVDSPIIIGTTCGINSENGNKFEYYDGKIFSKTDVISGDITNIEEGKKVQLSAEIINEEEYQVARLVDAEVYENGIAQIGDNIYKTAYSLIKAINEIPINTEEAVVVTILDNFGMSQGIEILSKQNIKIDLNGKTITTMSSIVNRGTLEITDSTENNEGKFYNTEKDGITNRGNLILSKGTIEGQRYGIYTFTSNVTIGKEDGEVNDSIVVIQGEKKGIAGYDSSNKAKMYDGIIKGKSSSKSYVSNTEEGYKVYDYKEGNYYITALQLESPIARVGGQDYYNLQTAIDNCENGETVELLRSAVNIKNILTIAEEKNITLDLKQYTINSNLEKTIINNGTLNISNSSGTIRNTKISGITIENNGELNVLKGTVDSDYGTAVENNGILNVSGGTIDGYNYGIKNNEEGILSISGGYVNSYQYAIYNNSTNAINITGGTIQPYGSSFTSIYGIYNNIAADINITGGNINYSTSGGNSYVYGIYNNLNGNILLSTSGSITIASPAYGYGIYNKAEGNLKLEKGNISITGQNIAAGIKNVSKGKVEILGGSINTTSNVGIATSIENGALGTLEIGNVSITVNTNTGTAYGIHNMSIKPLTIKQGTIKVTGEKSSYGIYNNTSDLVIGENNETVTIDAPVIESDYMGVYVSNVGKINFYDGQVIGQESINTDANTPEGYRLLKYYDNNIKKEVAKLSNDYVITYYINGEEYESVILKPGNEITKKIVDEEGYEFSGWSEMPETMPAQDINVYGMLIPKKYTITYYVDGVQYGEIDTVEYKAEITPREIPIKEGHEFGGWSEMPETMPAENIEVRGVFTYTATFYNEDKTSVIATVPFTVNSTSITEPGIPEKDGYIGLWDSYEVKAEDLEIQITYVEKKAVINKTQAKSYDSIEIAIAEVNIDAKKEEIYLLDNVIAVTITILENANVVLDLNGYTITNDSTYCGINNYGTLKIEDNSSAKTGSIKVEKVDADIYGIYNRENADTTIISGSITVNSGEEYTGTGVYNSINASITLGTKEGDVSTTDPSVQSTTYGINNESNSIFNFYDGKITAKTTLYGKVSGKEFGYRVKTVTNGNAYTDLLEKIQNGTKLRATDENGIAWYYTYQDGTATNVYYCAGVLSETIYMPSSLDDYKVISLNNNTSGLGYRDVFKNAKENRIIKNIIIPNGIESIGHQAFAGSTSLVSIKIPNSVTSIGGSAFSNSTSLTDIYIDQLEGNITFGSRWDWGISAHIHYSDCKHYIINEIVEDSIYIEDISENIEKEKICCGETYKFKLVDKEGKMLKNKVITIKTQGEEKLITPNEEGIYIIENIKRNTTIVNVKDITNGMNLSSKDINGTIWNYTYQEGKATKVYCDSKEVSEEMIIPSKLSGYPVTSLDNTIGLSAKSITIPDTVVDIGGNFAFSSCYNLININVDPNNQNYSSEGGVLFNKEKTILIRYPENRQEAEYIVPSGVESIEANAFSSSTNLTSIEIPESVKRIRSRAFNFCISLENINIPNDIEDIESGAFSYTKWYDIQPNGVIYAGKIAYEYKGTMPNESIIQVKDGTEKIQQGLFQHQDNLMGIELPDSITKIGNGAFYNCTSLTNINIPESVTSIGYSAFVGCTSLTDITLPNDIINIENRLFSGCTKLKTITIPEKVTSIGDDAFYDCSALVTIEVPSNVVSIGDNAFKTRGILTSINVNENNQNYSSENGVLFDKQKTILIRYPENKEGAEYIIPNTVISIENNAFSDCLGLTHITILDGVKTIENSAFKGCVKLNNIMIPNTVINIGNNVFEGCDSLISVNIPNSVRNMGGWVFAGCDNLLDITLPSDIEEVGEYMFIATAWYSSQPDGIIYVGKVAYDYKGTVPDDTTIEIKDGITKIENMLFYEQENLIDVELPDSLVSIGDRAFEECSNLTSIDIPDNVTSIGYNAFYNCISLKSISMSKNVNYIGEAAFAECTSLSSIIIWKNVGEVGYRTFGRWGVDQIINIEAEEIPSGWHEEWNEDCNAQIVYAYTGD